MELPCIEETFAGVFLRMVKRVGLERVVKDVLMRLWGVQKGCVKIAELIVSVLFAPVAQRIERRFPKPCVGGSNPLGSANLKPLENIDISVISAVFVLLAIYHLL